MVWGYSVNGSTQLALTIAALAFNASCGRPADCSHPRAPNEFTLQAFSTNDALATRCRTDVRIEIIKTSALPLNLASFQYERATGATVGVFSPPQSIDIPDGVYSVCVNEGIFRRCHSVRHSNETGTSVAVQIVDEIPDIRITVDADDVSVLFSYTDATLLDRCIAALSNPVCEDSLALKEKCLAETDPSGCLSDNEESLQYLACLEVSTARCGAAGELEVNCTGVCGFPGQTL
jgi:hypothetical protein